MIVKIEFIVCTQFTQVLFFKFFVKVYRICDEIIFRRKLLGIFTRRGHDVVFSDLQRKISSKILILNLQRLIFVANQCVFGCRGPLISQPICDNGGHRKTKIVVFEWRIK